MDQFDNDGIRTELRRFSPAVSIVFGGQADAELFSALRERIDLESAAK